MLKRFLISAVLGFGVLAASQSAMALSCMRPDLAQTMEEAKQSETIYHVLVGKFETLNFFQRPTVDLQNQFKPQRPQIARAWFEGYSLGPNRRQDVKLSRFPVDMEISCAGPWCGGPPPSDATQIAFVEARHGRAPLLKISACPGNVFPVTPRDGQVKMLRSCFYDRCPSTYDHHLER